MNEGGGGSSNSKSLDQRLPEAVLCTILSRLDVPSICSSAATCSTFKHCASQILSYLASFHLPDIALPREFIRPLLPPNPYLRSLKVDCGKLDDSAIEFMLRPSLHELCLYNCADFSGKLLSEIGGKCKDLRSLHLGAVAGKRGSVHDLEELLSGCNQLEVLMLNFDISLFLHHNLAQVWALATEKLTSLQIGFIYSAMVTDLLGPNVGVYRSANHIQPPVLPSIQKLCLSVDSVSDTMVGTISKGLTSLTHLDLRDAPHIEPSLSLDLTNAGLQQINQHGKLKHLSLIRSQEFLITYFKRVNDLGFLLMADNCADLESIYLGGFCRVTDTGYKTLLHSCSNLYKFRVSHGTQLTDLVFHDISATSLSLTHVSLRWCNLVTNNAIINLTSNTALKTLDLRNCKSLGDEALRAISSLSQLRNLLLDGSDISDAGASYLRHGVIDSLVSLSVRGCKRLTDRFISALFDNSSKLLLQELDLSNLPNLSDNGILTLTKSRVPISELRMRQCPLIGDTSIVALASMQVDEDRWYGSNLRLLDLYNCGGITQLSFRWLKKPYFPRLRMLGVNGSVNRDIVDALARNRPFLHVAGRGEELGVDKWESTDGLFIHDYDDVDELEQWDDVDEIEQWVLEEQDDNDQEMRDVE